MLNQSGHIKIFIDAIQNKTYVRKDAKRLEDTANLVISRIHNQNQWREVLTKHTINKRQIDAIVTKIQMQQKYINVNITL